MSTAACRRCSGLISFVLASNGRWRPVEAEYLALELEEDEVIALRVEGNLTAANQSEVRVYRYHRCPEDPALRRGQARTVVVAPEVVDSKTGELIETDGLLMGPVQRTYPTREPYTCETCGAVDDHDEDECPKDDDATWRNAQEKRRYERCKARIPATQVGVACPVCHTIAGEPCWNTSGGYRESTHDQRGWVTAFGDDEPWPPDEKQRGYRVMNRWLAINSNIFATPTPRSTE